ncbi:NAD(P)/FAD-dependent oxidoreductase [Parvularcula sp. IMCC14364]|uniref:NAD(P)/FAD-dependent oxidoreductase n=1 Tax=Parvularcula sp. IMCC14364 TaxID=3067902 RepID=UPI002740BFC9|nr:FAD-dependent oxidoreductase [Parvularcula sp. IMCC14364]
MKIAIIGSGITGLAAAYSLHKLHEITVFEADNRVGGHSHTVEMPDGLGGTVAVDTGFIVYNTHNYPNLVHLFDESNVTTEESDMSFAISIGGGKTEYLGEPRGMFAQKRNLLRPSHWAMIRDIMDFYKKAPKLMESAKRERKTLGDVLTEENYSKAFRYRHILPMAGAIWSMPVEKINDFPAEALISFLENHRLFEMDLLARPVWRTVSGGSREYITKITAGFADRIVTGSPIVSAQRKENGVHLQIAGKTNSEDVFDEVIFACHPDQALNILGNDATPEESAILNGIQYEKNTAVLHTDRHHMPRREKAWASWNYMADREAHSDETLSPVALTYWMNRLQNLKTAEPVFVTLNPLRAPDPARTYGSFDYAHPQFSRAALDSQQALKNIQGIGGRWYCGAWCGHGFHEDGAASGFAVAAALGAPPSWAGKITQMSPAAENAMPVRLSGTGIAAE